MNLREITCVAGFGGKTIGRDGYVRSVNGRIIGGSPNQDGYLQVKNKWGRQFLIHRIVAMEFVHNPRPDLFKVVDHRNGCPADNRAENLMWLTPKLNSMNRRYARLAYFNNRRKRWVGRTCGRTVGRFRTFQEARNAALSVRTILFTQEYKRQLDEPKRTRNLERFPRRAMLA